MKDRIRLKKNPPNVSTPAGSVDLYFDSSGNLVKEMPGGAKEPVGSGSVTSASVVAAIAGDPAATRTAAGLGDSATQDAADLPVSTATQAALDDGLSLKEDILDANVARDDFSDTNLRADVLAYKNRERLADPFAATRLNAFIQGLEDLGLTLNEGLFLGAGMVSSGNDPAAFVSRAKPSQYLAITPSEVTHGRLWTTNGSAWRHTVTPATDFTMLVWHSQGNGTINTNSPLMQIGSTSFSDYVSIRPVNKSGALVAQVTKQGFGQAFSGTFGSGYANQEFPTMFAAKWDDGLGVYVSADGAAWSVITVYAQTLAGRLDYLQAGAHQGTIQASVLLDGLLTDQQLAAVKALANRTIVSSGLRVVQEGDSLLAGGNEWVEIAARSGNWAGAYLSLADLATGGETAKQVYDQAAAGSFNSYTPTATFPETWAIIQVGHNDLGNFAASGDYTNAAILTHLDEICRYAREAGASRVILCTVCKGAGISGNGRLADADAINASIRAGDLTYPDVILDVEAAISTAAGGGSYWLNETYFDVDHVHPNDTGRQVFADLLNAEVLPTRAQESGP